MTRQVAVAAQQIGVGRCPSAAQHYLLSPTIQLFEAFGLMVRSWWSRLDVQPPAPLAVGQGPAQHGDPHDASIGSPRRNFDVAMLHAGLVDVGQS
jgi:hypothetical protein